MTFSATNWSPRSHPTGAVTSPPGSIVLIYRPLDSSSLMSPQAPNSHANDEADCGLTYRAKIESTCKLLKELASLLTGFLNT